MYCRPPRRAQAVECPAAANGAIHVINHLHHINAGQPASAPRVVAIHLGRLWSVGLV